MHPTALHSLAHATRLLAGLGQPHTLPGHIIPMGASSSHLTRLIPRDALTTPRFLLPRARFQQQPRMRPSPRRQVGLCDMHPAADAPSPASAPSYQGRGAAEEEYFHAAYLWGVPLPRPALVPVGACPRQERIARCERCQRHVSHPWERGGDSQGEGMGFKADPHMSHRLPDYLGAKGCPAAWEGPILLPCREGLHRLPDGGQGRVLGDILPSAAAGMPGCPAQSGIPSPPPCAHLPSLRVAGVTWPKPWEPPSEAPRAAQPNASLYNPFFTQNFAPWQ